MIELSITANNAAPSPPATPVSGVASGGFARAFEAVTDSPPATALRQGDAADGKKLPADAAGRTGKPAKPAGAHRHGKADVEPDSLIPLPVVAPSSPDSDDAPADGDTASGDNDKTTPITALFAMPVAAPIVIDPAKLPAGAPVGVGSAVARAPAAPGAFDPALAATPTTGTPVAIPAPAGTGPAPPAFELLDAGMPAKAVTAPADVVDAPAPRIEVHADTPRFAIAATPVAADPATVAVQPARQAFATALAALSARAPTHDDDSGDPQQPIAGLAAPTADTLLKAAVQQAAAGDQAALDPRQDRGLHGMIDHIEMLRDDANARDTRIRLSPDALGTVDVALRRDGDAVHVRFSSPNEATRQVLNDAQPRLTTLAETRGVRIAGSSIDGGTGGGSQPQPQPRTESPRPARAPRAAAADTDTPTDQRLA